MSANDACATTLGHDPGALVGRRFVDIVTPPVGFEVPAGDLLGSLGQMLRAELPMAMPDGSARWLEVHITPVPRLGIAFAVCRDVTLRHDRTTRLAHDASHDALTDLPNRRRLVELLEDAIAFQGPPPALLFVDLDGFKAVNDALGHEAGDDLLRLVAWRMQESTRADDVVARFAGDEFCVLLRNASSATVQAVAQRIVVALSTPFAVAGDLVSIAASVGGAVHRVGEPAEELLRRADRTMYRAKQAGGDRVDLELLTA
jgi:diguanylate cyclase (GGDEF)-like protein